MNETLYHRTFNFQKVVRQQNSGAVEGFILSYSEVYLRIQKWKNYWNRSTFAKVIVKIKVAPFYGPRCSYGTILIFLCAIHWFQCIPRAVHFGDVTSIHQQKQTAAVVRQYDTDVIKVYRPEGHERCYEVDAVISSGRAEAPLTWADDVRQWWESSGRIVGLRQVNWSMVRSTKRVLDSLASAISSKFHGEHPQAADYSSPQANLAKEARCRYNYRFDELIINVK